MKPSGQGKSLILSIIYRMHLRYTELMKTMDEINRKMERNAIYLQGAPKWRTHISLF